MYGPSSGDSLAGNPIGFLLSTADVRQIAYRFDGLGGYFKKDWDLTEGKGAEFCWYHVELPKAADLVSSAKFLADALSPASPPFKLYDILALTSNGPFCAHVDGALYFRVNSPGPTASIFTLKIAGRVTEHSVITVSLGRIPRLGFSDAAPIPLLSEVPRVEINDRYWMGGGSSVDYNVVIPNPKEDGKVAVIPDHVLEFYMAMNHWEEADNPVPKTASNLLVHIVDRHLDHVQDIVTKLEMELDGLELELDKGCNTLKTQMLSDRRFPRMHLDLQRLLQAVSHGEQVFPRMKEKCATKSWFANEDILALEELIGRHRRLKENLGCLSNRVMTVQAGLESWQTEQTNGTLKILAYISMIFHTLTLITGIFGMNVGGVPWTAQYGPDIDEEGFHNVVRYSGVVLVSCFILVSFWERGRISAWSSLLKGKWSIKSFLDNFRGRSRRSYIPL